METTTAALLSLSESECQRLLHSYPVAVGRIGVNDADGQPLVVPVNYRMDDGAVIFRTAVDSLLTEHAIGNRVAFEVDDVDPSWQEGWSVLVQGIAQEVTDVVELQHLRRLPLRPWAPGKRPVYVRIVPTVITGRRIM